MIYTKTHKVLIGIVAFLIFCILIILLPEWIAKYQLAIGTINSENIGIVANQYRGTLIQIIGGFAVILGIYVAYRRMIVLEKQLDNTERQIELVQRGQINDRFTRAVELLSNEQLDVRIGALITLEEICYESEALSETIFKIIHAFVSRRAGRRYMDEASLERTESDVIEGLDILIRVSEIKQDCNIILKDIDLVSYNLFGSKLKNKILIRFINCRLKDVYFDLSSPIILIITNSKIEKTNFISDFSESLVRISNCSIADNSEIDIFEGKLRITNSIITGSDLNLTDQARINKCLFKNVRFLKNKYGENIINSFFDNCNPIPIGVSKEQIINDEEQFLEKIKEWKQYFRFQL